MCMELVECTNQYWEFVRTLRIDPRVIGGFINQSYISKNDQKKFMKKKSKFFRICIIDKKPVGYIGLIGVNKDEITLCVDPFYHNKGIGSFMLKELTSRSSINLWSKVKLKNKSSIKLFEKNGFEKGLVKGNLIYYYFKNEK